MGLAKELMLRYHEMDEFIEEIENRFGEKNVIVVENDTITINTKDYLNFSV